MHDACLRCHGPLYLSGESRHFLGRPRRFCPYCTMAAESERKRAWQKAHPDYQRSRRARIRALTISKT